MFCYVTICFSVRVVWHSNIDITILILVSSTFPMWVFLSYLKLPSAFGTAYSGTKPILNSFTDTLRSKFSLAEFTHHVPQFNIWSMLLSMLMLPDFIRYSFLY